MRGGNAICIDGCGTLFRLKKPAPGTNSWTKETLVTFNLANGGKPLSKLLLDAAGSFYGTTYEGGNEPCIEGPYVHDPLVIGCGTVSKFTPPAAGNTNWTHTVIHHFDSINGAFSEGGVIADANGNFYGVTKKSSGDVCGLGQTLVLYKLTPPPAGQIWWTPSYLYKFDLTTSGTNVLGELVAAPDGRLYGTAFSGGQYYGGTLFEITR